MIAKFTLYAAVTALAVLLGPAASNAQALRKVTINYGINQFAASTAPLFAVPKAMHFWEQEGLDVTIQGGAGGAAALQALVSGGSVMTFTGTPNLMQLRQAGVPLVAVASGYVRNIYFPVTKQGGPIHDLKDLAGKTVGVCAIVSACTNWLDAALKSEGIDPASVRKVAPGDGGAAWHALDSGTVAALMWWDAAYSQMETVGAHFNKFDNLPILQNLTFITGLMVTEDRVKSDPKLIIGLLRGIAKGVAFAKANPEAAIRLHWSVFPLSKSTSLTDSQAMASALVELNAQLHNMQDPEKKSFGAVGLDDVKAVSTVMVEQGVIATALPPERYFTNQFIAAANDFDLATVTAAAKTSK